MGSCSKWAGNSQQASFDLGKPSWEQVHKAKWQKWRYNKDPMSKSGLPSTVKDSLGIIDAAGERLAYRDSLIKFERCKILLAWFFAPLWSSNEVSWRCVDGLKIVFYKLHAIYTSVSKGLFWTKFEPFGASDRPTMPLQSRVKAVTLVTAQLRFDWGSQG